MRITMCAGRCTRSSLSEIDPCLFRGILVPPALANPFRAGSPILTADLQCSISQHLLLLGNIQGEQDRKSRALSYLALDLDRPAMGLDDPVNNRQPQSTIASFGTFP